MIIFNDTIYMRNISLGVTYIMSSQMNAFTFVKNEK